MCGRYTLTSDIGLLSERFEFDLPSFVCKPRYNVAPSQHILVVTESLTRQLEYFEWGSIPYGANFGKTNRRVINLRSENLYLDEFTGTNLNRGRCLVLADSFFEWELIGGTRRPTRIGIRELKPFAFAGIWQNRRDQSGSVKTSCAIVTCKANDFMGRIHHRMPVILTADSESTWLDPDVKQSDTLRSVLVPYSSDLMEMQIVSERVNSPANDDPMCVVPMTRR